MAYFIENGFEAPNSQIKLVAHAIMTNGDKNNAVYIPSGPYIRIGDGDGEILQNLGTDGDVVSHELGHHVIFQSLTSTSGESLVLHEGLADFLTFSRTGDACLGESICPANPAYNICEVQGQCLRTADNDITFEGENWPNEVHKRGQLISGLLRDLSVEYGIEEQTITKTTLRAITYLAASSGYRDFIVSMLVADKELNNEQHGCTIWEAAIERGLEERLEGLSCEAAKSSSQITGVVKVSNSSQTTPTTSRSKGSSDGSTFCAVAPSSNSNRNLGMFFLLLMPVLVSSLKRYKDVK